MNYDRANRMGRGLLGPWVALLTMAFVAGCGGETDAPFVDAGGIDSGFDVPDIPRVIFDTGGPDVRGRVCTRSSQCDDGVMCTQDICAADGRCINVPSPMACDDNIYCNGLELCDVRRGCVAGTPVACNDNYTCTIDRCDEETKTCVHTPRDFDRDGDPDIRCFGPACGDAGVAEPDSGVETACWRGGDCDDSNPRVNARLPEICGDNIDNNCNGLIDAMEPGGCQRPMGDTCEAPLDISRGGRFTVPLTGAAGDFPIQCAGGAMLQRDVVTRLRLTEPRDLAITAASTGPAIYLQIQDSCGAVMGNAVRGCVLGFPTVYRARALPAGEYFIVLAASGSSSQSAEVDLTVELNAATQPPTNQTCASPTVIPPSGGTFMGDLVGVSDDVITRCGGTNPDLVYAITLTEPRDLSARVVGNRNEYLQVSLLNQCARSPTTLRCANGSPSQFLARSLQAGTYYIAVEGPRTASNFTLEVTTGAPTQPPPGDTCASPLELIAGTPSMGTFANFEDDLTLSCAGSNSRDVVYRFTLTETRDINLTLRGASNAYYYMALQRSCGQTMNEVCRSASAPTLSARGLDPGTYFVVVKVLQGTDYTLTLDTRAPLPAMAVMGNDTCDQAAAIPAGGGVFTGSTATLRRDYQAPCQTAMTSEDAVFRFTVTSRARVNFSTEGSSFDTVLWVTSADACPGRAVPGACNDDGPGLGTASSLNTVLEPGSYYVFIGGFSAAARGNYTLTVLPSAL